MRAASGGRGYSRELRGDGREGHPAGGSSRPAPGRLRGARRRRRARSPFSARRERSACFCEKARTSGAEAVDVEDRPVAFFHESWRKASASIRGYHSRLPAPPTRTGAAADRRTPLDDAQTAAHPDPHGGPRPRPSGRVRGLRRSTRSRRRGRPRKATKARDYAHTLAGSSTRRRATSRSEFFKRPRPEPREKLHSTSPHRASTTGRSFTG